MVGEFSYYIPKSSKKKKYMKQDKLIGGKNIKHKTNKFHSAFGYFSLISVLDILRSF